MKFNTSFKSLEVLVAPCHQNLHRGKIPYITSDGAKEKLSMLFYQSSQSSFLTAPGAPNEDIVQNHLT